MAATELAMRVPDDLALVGVGELSWSRALISPITSLVEPVFCGQAVTVAAPEVGNKP